jgi:hypothetical protein
MLTSYVVVSCQSDRTAPRSLLPATSQVTKSPVVHPLSIEQVTKCFSRNSFVLKTIHFDGAGVCTGVCTLCWLCPTTVISSTAYLLSLSPLYSHSSALFCTSLHASKIQLISFQAIPHSASKNGPGWGTPRFFSRIEMNRIRPYHISIGATRCRLHRQPTRSERSPCPRFASQPHSFLVNYSDPILYSAGPAGHLSHSARSPRS